jgi:hypothetical protein
MATVSTGIKIGAPVAVVGTATYVSGPVSTTLYTIPAGFIFWGTFRINSSVSGGGNSPFGGGAVSGTGSTSATLGGTAIFSLSASGPGPAAATDSDEVSFSVMGPGAVVLNASVSGKGSATITGNLVGTLLSN